LQLASDEHATTSAAVPHRILFAVADLAMIVVPAQYATLWALTPLAAARKVGHASELVYVVASESDARSR